MYAITVALFVIASCACSEAGTIPADLADDVKNNQAQIDQLIKQNQQLQKQVNQLTASGYDEFTAQELQWQSLHMSAAAACRASSPGGGTGHYPNVVFARTHTTTCTDICKASEFKICDATVSIMGYMGKAASSQQVVGWYYNYGCDKVGNHDWEPETDFDITAIKRSYVGYCCCRSDAPLPPV